MFKNYGQRDGEIEIDTDKLLWNDKRPFGDGFPCVNVYKKYRNISYLNARAPARVCVSLKFILKFRLSFVHVDLVYMRIIRFSRLLLSIVSTRFYSHCVISLQVYVNVM